MRMKHRLFLLLLGSTALVNSVLAAPTDGFVEVPYTYYIQYPWDLQLGDRYAVTNGVHYFWVYSTDQPFQQGNATLPRTEMRILNNYTNGVWQFEGDLYVPSGTTGVAVMQVFGGQTSSTSCQLRVYNGSLCRYTATLKTNVYNTWIHVNVIHDADAHTVTIYLDGVQVRTDPDRGPATYYFKCGVYTQDNPSDLMQSEWANIKVWRRAPKIDHVAMAAGEVVIRGTNGTPGAACYVLSSTNLTQPLGEWTRLATNLFDGNGSFSYTNAVDPNLAQRFYLLQLE
jgi:Alginate lyase